MKLMYPDGREPSDNQQASIDRLIFAFGELCGEARTFSQITLDRLIERSGIVKSYAFRLAYE